MLKRKEIVNLAFGFFATFGVMTIFGCVSSNGSGIPAQTIPVETSVLTNNLWQKTDDTGVQKYYKFFDDGFMMYATTFSISGNALPNVAPDGFVIENVHYEFKWSLQEGKLTYDLVNYNNKYEGSFVDEFTIKGKEKRRGDLVRVTDQQLIDKYNSPKYNFSPMQVLPIKAKRISDNSAGASQIDLTNPNDYNVVVAIVNGDAADYMGIHSKTSGSLRVPNGSYEIYFVTSDEPDTLYQGDTITVRNQKTEITFTAVNNGNYGIKKVN
jgi:hypothetical protein